MKHQVMGSADELRHSPETLCFVIFISREHLLPWTSAFFIQVSKNQRAKSQTSSCQETSTLDFIFELNKVPSLVFLHIPWTLEWFW